MTNKQFDIDYIAALVQLTKVVIHTKDNRTGEPHIVMGVWAINGVLIAKQIKQG